MTTRPLDTRAWIVWLAAMLVVSLVSFNPWLQIMTIAIVVMLWWSDPRPAEAGFLHPRVLTRLAVVLLLFGGLFNALVSHYGELVVLRLPAAIPLLGGIISVEAFVYGLCNSLRLISIILAFALFSRNVPYADLLRLVPVALFDLGLVTSIGLRLVPLSLKAAQEIRAAQALRGHRDRGLRGAIPLFTPLVANGMEHALALAEALESRGYGGVMPTRRLRTGQVLLLSGVLALLLLIPLHSLLALDSRVLPVLLAVIAGLIGAGVRLIGTGTRTRLRRSVWGWPETLVTAVALAAVAGLLTADRIYLVFDPFRLTTAGLPVLNPWLALLLMGLLAPALATRQRNADDHIP